MDTKETTLEFRPTNSDADLLKILDLQRANLFGNVSEDNRKSEGFLKIQHNLGLLQTMQEAVPQIIALDGDVIAGYALCMHRNHKHLIPDLTPLFEYAETHVSPETDYVIMGQICVAEPYRRKGVFRNLYKTLGSYCAPLPLVTEIATINLRSLSAHKAIGFRSLGTHQEADICWQVVMWP
jgi:GNAT superfamily N-acetyltransferase